MSENSKQIDLAKFRSRAPRSEGIQLGRPDGVTHGRRFWRSLEELGASEEFTQLVHREFPQAASEWDDNDGGVSRRNFMKVMGASLALAGLGTVGGCKRADEKIVPYVQQPEQLVPGRPLFYASAFPFGGYAKGVLVEQHEGRPTKIEGNPDHPASLGATDVHTQASILTMYDPDRSQTLTRFGEAASWGTFLAKLGDYFRYADPNGKSTVRAQPPRVRVLTETITSPTLTAQLKALASLVPDFGWHAFDPVGRSNTRLGAARAFGQDVAPIYHFEHAKVVVSLESDFLVDDPGSVRYARKYIDQRRVRHDHPTPRARLYAIESTPTLTGAMADHCKRITPQGVSDFARRLLAAVSGPMTDAQSKAIIQGSSAVEWIGGLVKDLLANKGASVVVCGEYQPPEVHAIVHAINVALGNVGEGKPVTLIKAVETSPAGKPAESVKKLVDDMRAGGFDVLLILGGNPAYTAPADVGPEADPKLGTTPFGGALAAFSTALGADKRPKNFVAHLSLYNNETSAQCQWHVPQSYFLEAWGDARAFDGTASIVQPLIAPLYAENKSAVELVAAVLTAARREPATMQPATTQPATTQPATTQPATGDPIDGPSTLTGSGYEIVRSVWRTWHAAHGGGDFETFWYDVLLKGLVPGSAADLALAGPVALAADAVSAVASTNPAAPATGFTVIFRPDPCVWDGQFSNNGWLQELPKPLLKYTWENAIVMSRKTAEALGLVKDASSQFDSTELSNANGMHVELSVDIGAIRNGIKGPVWVMPGHPDDCVTVHLGYGRRRGGRVAGPDGDQIIGFNAYHLRTGAAHWVATGGTLAKADGRHEMASTQNHQMIESIGDLAKREVTYFGYSVDQLHETYGHHGKSLPVLNPDDPARSPESLYSENPDHLGGHTPGYAAWAMVVDQSACIGCNACVVACQSENNIPVVGKAEVIKGREMHWLRIDTYYNGPMEAPEHTLFQPMACVHCEKAPCEVVCPVAATTHSKEGLNEMTYNRCVGTRYCSNNCPYKVRRFNFFRYSDLETPQLKLMRNPEVTVRQRGVMEKCTYCVQRINRGRIEAKKDNDGRGRPIRDGDVTTACAQACPTQAITFGDWSNPANEVSKLKQEPRGFHFAPLMELDTRPRTSYFARVYNPLDPPKSAAHGGGGHAPAHGKAGEKH